MGFLSICSCGRSSQHGAPGAAAQKSSQWAHFGKEITPDGAREAAGMYAFYRDMGATDTLGAKFRGMVKEVCQAKGCWMKVALTDGHEVMVRFKDYGFFVPKDICGKEVVLSGRAFTEIASVEDLRHLARDAGKRAHEIALIGESETGFGFEAEGVLIRK